MSGISVPQNFIPGFTKPRLSINQDSDSELQRRRVDSMCHQGVQVKFKDNHNLPEKLLMDVGLLALNLPVSSQHVKCSKKDSQSYVEHLKRTLEAPQYNHDKNGDKNINFPSSRRKTMPIITTVERHVISEAASRRLTENKNLFNVNSGVGYTLRHVSTALSSLPDLSNLVDNNITADGQLNVNLNLPFTEKRRSRSFSNGLNYPPELITPKVKRKISYAFSTIDSQPLTKEDNFLALEKERETLDTVQNTLRSKLPKTFQVCAGIGLAHPLLCKQRQIEFKHEDEKRKRGIRTGSLPAIFHKHRHTCSPTTTPANTSAESHKIWNFMKIIVPTKTNYSKSVKKSQSFDDSNRLQHIERISEAPSSPFTRASKYTRKIKEIRSDDERKRDSDSSIDSGIIMKSTDDEEAFPKSSNDNIITKIQSSKTVFLSPRQSFKIKAIDGRSQLRIRSVTETSQTKISEHVVQNKIFEDKKVEEISTCLPYSLNHDNLSPRCAAQDQNNQKPHLEQKQIKEKHIIKRPNLDISPHLLNNDLSFRSEIRFQHKHKAFDENSNVLAHADQNMTERKQRIQQIEDEIASHLREIDEIFKF